MLSRIRNYPEEVALPLVISVTATALNFRVFAAIVGDLTA